MSLHALAHLALVGFIVNTKLIENSQIKLKVGLILKNDRLSRSLFISDVDYSDRG